MEKKKEEAEEDPRNTFAFALEDLINSYCKEYDLTKGDVLITLELMCFDIKCEIRQIVLNSVGEEENLERGVL